MSDNTTPKKQIRAGRYGVRGAGIGIAMLVLAVGALIPAMASAEDSTPPADQQVQDQPQLQDQAVQDQTQAQDQPSADQQVQSTVTDQATTQQQTTVQGNVKPESPPPGNNGDVKVHEEGVTADSDTRDVPHVCLPRFVGFNFDANQGLTWWLDQQPPTGNANQIGNQNITADGSGGFVVTNAQISTANGGAVPPGHYKLNWSTGAPGDHKFKVFWVDDCSQATGTLKVKKLTTGGGVPSDTTYTVTVTCTDPAFTTTVDIPTAQVGDEIVVHIPLNDNDTNSCSVSETGKGDPAPSSVTYAPAGIGDSSDTQTVGVETTPLFTVTNSYPDVVATGTISVKKVIDPTGGAAANGDQYVMRIDCPGSANDQDITLTYPGTLGPVSSNAIPAGTKCTVSEITKPNTATLVSYSPDGGTATTPPEVTVVGDSEVAVVITNKYPQVAGQVLVTLNVDKALIGSGKPANGTAFTVHVVCTGAANVNVFLTFTYPNGLGAQSIQEQIPADETLSCEVTETDKGGEKLEGYRVDGGPTQPGTPKVELDVNRVQGSVTVVNDPSVIAVAGTSVTATASGQLPFTGGGPGWTLTVGLGLLIAGGALVLVTRNLRRRGLMT
jgi:hypothetical protein